MFILVLFVLVLLKLVKQLQYLNTFTLRFVHIVHCFEYINGIEFLVKICYNCLNSKFRRLFKLYKDNKIYDKTSANASILGFEYQYLFFINELLKLEKNQKIGFEELDDVHIELVNNGKNALHLYQVKHTLKTNAAQTPKNLTDLDSDLWKTLYNWIEVIKKNDNKIEFIQSTSFFLVTNKKITKGKLASKIHLLTPITNKFEELITYIKNLSTKDNTLNYYMNCILNTDDSVLKEFFYNIEFINIENIQESIFSGIRNKMVSEKYVGDVYKELLGELKASFFECAKEKRHQVISHNEFISNKYIRIFEKYRTTNLTIRKFEHSFDDNVFEMSFIKELIEISALEKEEINEGIEIYSKLLEYENNIKLWENDGDINLKDIEDLFEETFVKWKNKHKSSHRLTKQDKSKDCENALNCLDYIMGTQIKLLETDLSTLLSNGHYYSLSRDEKIGWKYMWKDNYNYEQFNTK